MEELKDTAAKTAAEMEQNAALTQQTIDTTKPAEWYKAVSLEDAKAFIRTNLTGAARSFIAIGYYLKHIRDRELYKEDGHATIWDFAQAEYGISKSTASRYMTMNDRFSVDGNSPILMEEYQGFDKSKLQEMLSLTDEQLEQVTPEMKVQEIRSMRMPREIPYFEIDGQLDMETSFPETIPPTIQREKPQEFTLDVSELLGNQEESVATSQQENQPLSAYGTPKMERPEDSLISTKGCEGGHDCFCCHLECDIRQEACRCVEAPTGNPFPCQIIGILDNLREDIGNCCQFVDLDKAFHRAGDNEPVPCCKKCDQVCVYRCNRSTQEKENQIPNDEAKPNQDEGHNPWEEPEEIDESWNLGDMPQAKEKYVAKLAKAVVNEYGSRMIFRFGGLSGKEAVNMLTSKCGGTIDIGEGVNAYAAAEIIEFYSGDTDLGVCSYGKFETQVEKALEVWKQDQNEKQKDANDLSEHDELPDQEEPQEQVIDADFTDITEPDEELNEKLPTDLQIARQELERANNLLKKCLKDLPDETDIHIRGMKIKAAALASFVRDLDDIGNPPPKPEQPELTMLTNNDQRAAFVDAYETWPIWIETKETGERYYRYDLPDGTSMVVKVYHSMLFDYNINGLKYEERFSEGYGRHEYYLLQPGKFFKDCEANRSALINKLKEIQKKKG